MYSVTWPVIPQHPLRASEMQHVICFGVALMICDCYDNKEELSITAFKTALFRSQLYPWVLIVEQ
jgi:hypothetical protein